MGDKSQTRKHPSPQRSPSAMGEGGRVLQGGVSTPCGENRAAWGPRFGAGELLRNREREWSGGRPAIRGGI